MPSDFIIVNHEHQPVVAVEVKARPDTSAAWAAQLARNLRAHGLFPSVPFFLLVTPSRLYLWRRDEEKARADEPSLEIDAGPFLAPYFERSGIDPGDVHPHVFELVVAAWMSDLAHAEELSGPETRGQDALAGSGLLQAIRSGHVMSELAA